MTDTQTNTSAGTWLDDATHLLPGDVIAQQFGADRPAIERIEWLDASRARLHHVDGTTSRVTVDAGQIRIRPRLISSPAKACAECGTASPRYERYGFRFCASHIGLAERHRPASQTEGK